MVTKRPRFLKVRSKKKNDHKNKFLTTTDTFDSSGLMKTKYLTKNHVGVIIPDNNGNRFRVEWNGITNSAHWVDANKKFNTSLGPFTYDELKKYPDYVKLYLLLEIELHKMNLKDIKKLAKKMDINDNNLVREKYIELILNYANRVPDKNKMFVLLLLMDEMRPYIRKEITNIMDIVLTN